MNILNIISIIILLLFAVLFYRAFRNKKFSEIWKDSQTEVLVKQKIKKAEADGLKPFEIAGITYYAKSQAGAIYQHKVFKRQQKKY